MATSYNDMFFFYSPNQISIFDGKHYDYWSSQMETIFLSQDLWRIVDEGFEEDDELPSEEEGAGEQEKKAREIVMKNVMAKTIYPRLYGLKKAKEAWSVLKKEFQGSEKVTSIKLQGLWRDFDNLAMKSPKR
ncbi:hypothetical protein MLD38_037498 [Melastoma candidum]|uniref:Uncharacterized protein n=1 Tax=Melastoma candidum TaxID=119954 RepID=A0ACB9LNH1_9MYRT|nr:hypothetical protein MLD38_037498 [Melastoma candidum]